MHTTPQISAGFNRYAPLLSDGDAASGGGGGGGAAGVFDAIFPQMYNTSPAVETTAYAQTYARELTAGFTVSGGAAPLNVSVPAGLLWLGFPASRMAAGSGFIAPAAVVTALRELQRNGTAG